MTVEKLSLAAFQEAIESGLKGCHVHCLGLVARSLSCWLDELAKKKEKEQPHNLLPSSPGHSKTGGILQKYLFPNQLN